MYGAFLVRRERALLIQFFWPIPHFEDSNAKHESHACEVADTEEVPMVIQYEGSYSFQMQQMLTSLSQDSVAAFVIAFLQRHQIRFKQNSYHDIFYLDHPNESLVICSLDEASDLEDMNLLYQLEWENNPLSYSKHTVSEDEEFGVFLQLKMLQKYPNLNFIFRRSDKDSKSLQSRFLREAVILV